MKALATHLVRGLIIQVVSVGVWASMVYKGLEASGAVLGLGPGPGPPSILQNQAETMLGCAHITYFSLCHRYFSRGFSIAQLLIDYLFKRDLILNTLFLTLSAVIPALKDNTRLKLCNVKIISDLKNKAFESVF